jgi:hypothetical protein
VKPTVYIETSIVSYLTAKPSRDLIVAGHQQITQEWWENMRPKVECFVSPFVIQEVSRGDKESAQRRLESISGFPVLELNEEIQKLAYRYYVAIKIPESALIDASHLAVATWHNMDYLLSWNSKHIVSGRVRKILEEINSSLNIHTPVMCTPEELMEI